MTTCCQVLSGVTSPEFSNIADFWPISGYRSAVKFPNNGRDSFQLFVGVFDTCLLWYLLVLPSETHAVTNMTSLKAIDGDTSYHSGESFPLHPFFVSFFAFWDPNPI